MRFATALALVLLGASVAQAQDDADLDRAVVLFEESETLYNQGEFEQAAALLRRAYQLHPEPTLLFNLARALEGAGDLDGAIEGYEQYLEERPDAEDAGAIRARLQTLREQRARLEAEDAPDETAEPIEEVEDTPPETSDGGDDVMGILPWIVAGVGVATIGAGVGLGLVALDYGEQAQNEPTMRRAVSLQDEGETYALIANVLYIAGGAIAAAGVVWGVIVLADGGGDDASASLRVLPGGVELSGAF